MEKLRIAVIGAGRLGGFHAQKIAARDDLELAAVVDPVPGNRNQVAAACHTTPLADYRELLGRIDAAVIAAPTQRHHELALDLLRAGVHLLVEKPICSTTGQADELVEAARQNKVVLQVGHVERFNPAFNLAAWHTADPKYIESVRAGAFTFRSTDVGVVLDLMIHDIDLVLSLVRCRVRRVEALGLSVLGGHEDVANARIEFESGCVATLSASRVSYEPARRMQIWSAKAYAGIDFAARATTLVRPSETLLERRFDVPSLSAAQVEYYKEHLSAEHLPKDRQEFAAVDMLAMQLLDFADSIRKQRPPRVTGEAGRDALAVAEEILAQIHAHAWDASRDGRIGPLGVPKPRVAASTHSDGLPEQTPVRRREAG